MDENAPPSFAESVFASPHVQPGTIVLVPPDAIQGISGPRDQMVTLTINPAKIAVIKTVAGPVKESALYPNL